MKYLLFLLISFQVYSQDFVVLKRESFELKTVSQNNLLKLWAVNKFGSTRLRIYNPQNRVFLRKYIVNQGETYFLILNMADGAKGYYRIRINNLNVYYIKIKSIDNGILSENITYLFHY